MVRSSCVEKPEIANVRALIAPQMPHLAVLVCSTVSTPQETLPISNRPKQGKKGSVNVIRSARFLDLQVCLLSVQPALLSLVLVCRIVLVALIQIEQSASSIV